MEYSNHTMALNDSAIPPSRYRLGRARKLHGAKAFGRVFAGKTRHHCGLLAAWGVPNGLSFSRLGLSVSAAVGNAVQRNHIKRMLREAFRLQQHDLPAGYDWVLVVYRHEAKDLRTYQQLLLEATGRLHVAWRKRRA